MKPYNTTGPETAHYVLTGTSPEALDQALQAYALQELHARDIPIPHDLNQIIPTYLKETGDQLLETDNPSYLHG